MTRPRAFAGSTLLTVLTLSTWGCSRDLPTSSAVVMRAGAEARSGTAVVTLLPAAIASVRQLPEMGILEGGGVDGDAQSSYFRTTASNREFRRGFAEFVIPAFPEIFGATLALRETRASISLPVPPDRHELSSYTDVDLVVTTSDFDRPTTLLATFETDANLPDQTFEFDASSLVVPGARVGVRVKLEVDPSETGFRFLGSAFSGSSTPAGVTLEVVTTTAVAAVHLEDVVQAMDLPPDAKASLLAPAHRARELLTDDNPNNDTGACGQLGTLIREVDALEQDVLGAPRAWYLRQLALDLESGLGCGGKR